MEESDIIADGNTCIVKHVFQSIISKRNSNLSSSSSIIFFLFHGSFIEEFVVYLLCRYFHNKQDGKEKKHELSRVFRTGESLF